MYREMQSDKSPTQAFGLEFNKSRFGVSEDLLPWLMVNYKMDELVSEFWGVNTRANLVAVTKDLDNKSWRGLVSEWDSFSEQPGQFRLNKDLIRNLLDGSLGKHPFSFDLKKMTSLELSLFENFFVELENFWRDYWRVAEANAHGNLSFLVWTVEFENEEVGSLAIGVPPGLVPKKSLNHGSKMPLRQLANELNVSVPLDLTVGKTRLSITDIRNIEKGDLIYFENSDVRYFVWEKNELQDMIINLTLPYEDEAKGLYYDNLEIEDMMEQEKISDDLLADLPVELTAQFKGVNMPLQKVMELEAGGVLPLGLLLDSELILMAPGNKPIAQGDLVVVGNQFGLKIKKINLKSATIPQARLNDVPEVDPNLLEQAVQSAAPAQEPAAHDEMLDDMGEDDLMMDDVGEAPAAPAEGEPRKSVIDPELSKKLDQELADIGIDPSEFDDLDDLEDEDF